MIKAVLFDMIGTTVKTVDSDFILTSFRNAFQSQQVLVDEKIITSNRGKSKISMIKEVLIQQNASIELAEPIYESFKNSIHTGLDNFFENEEAEKVFSFLKQKNIKIGIGTGLSVSLFDEIYNHLDWRRHDFDYIGISESIGKSRPDPAMIFDMMDKLNIFSSRQVLKVGDTIADIKEGKNANTYTAVILAGTQETETLRAESPDFVLSALSDLLHIGIWQ